MRGDQGSQFGGREVSCTAGGSSSSSSGSSNSSDLVSEVDEVFLDSDDETGLPSGGGGSVGEPWSVHLASELAAGVIVEEIARGPREQEVHICARPSEATINILDGESPWPLDLGHELDWFQAVASRCNEVQENVLVVAPTSAGKTVVALHAIKRCISRGERCVYTAPIKALSNQKYKEFTELFGPEHVSLLTGDISAGNPSSASIVIMTTEVLVSMLYTNVDGGAAERRSVLAGMTAAIFDEFHYVGDESRGTAWEEAVVFLETHFCFVCLSATVPNFLELAGWLAQTRQAPCHVVFSPHRPKPLKHSIFADALKRPWEVFDEQAGRFKKNIFEQKCALLPCGRRARPNLQERVREINGLVNKCKRNDALPMIVFSFSRSDCIQLAKEFAKLRTVRPTEEQVTTIRRTAQNVVKNCLSFEDNELPCVRQMAEFILPNGIGVHHAGMLPILRELTEMLFQEGLLRVLFCTETFALGVNFSSRVAIFNWTAAREFHKFAGDSVRPIHVREYRQMAGRAGRRHDPHHASGHVVNIFSCQVDVDLARRVISGPVEPVNSNFNLSYGLILRCLRFGRGTLDTMLAKNFRQFQSGQAKESQMSDQLKAKLRVLRDLGLVKRSLRLTKRGEAAACVHTTTDELIVAALLASNFFYLVNTENADDLVAFLSCLAHDDEENEEVTVPDELRTFWDACEEQVGRICEYERHHGVEAKCAAARLKRLRCCVGYAECLQRWQKGLTFQEVIAGSGNADCDGLVCRAIRQTHSLMRQLAKATGILKWGCLRDILEGARCRLSRDGSNRRALPFLESIYLAAAFVPGTLEAEHVVKETPCPNVIGSTVLVHPRDIGFSHISISRHFQDGHGLLDTLEALLRGKRKREIRMMEVYWLREQYWTLSNRRLAVYRLFAQICPERAWVKVKVVGEERARQWDWKRKWTSGLWRGRLVRVRGTGEMIGRDGSDTSFDFDNRRCHPRPAMGQQSGDAGAAPTREDSRNRGHMPRLTGFAAACRQPSFPQMVIQDSVVDDDGGDNRSEAGDSAIAEGMGEESRYCAWLTRRSICLFVTGRRLVDPGCMMPLTPQSLANPATMADLADASCARACGPIPLRFSHIHEYLQSLAYPVLDWLRADLLKGVDANEFDPGIAHSIQLLDYVDAQSSTFKGDVPLLPEWCPGEGVEPLVAVGPDGPNGAPSLLARLPPFQVVLVFQPGSVRRPLAITSQTVQPIGADQPIEVSPVSFDSHDCYRIGMLHTKPDARHAVVVLGRSGAQPSWAGAEEIRVTYWNGVEQARRDVSVAESNLDALRLRVVRLQSGGPAESAGVRRGMAVVRAPDGGFRELQAIAAPPGHIAARHPVGGSPITLVFRQERIWCVAPTTCNLVMFFRVAAALETPDLHYPIFWQDEVSGTPDGDSGTWCSTSEEQCVSLLGGADALDQHLMRLNESQRRAVKELATCRRGVRLLHGPPGTGKTHTLVKLLELCATLSLAEQNRGAGKSPGDEGDHGQVSRCLVCAPSNVAVREVALRFVQNMSSRDALESSWHQVVLPQIALVAAPERLNVEWGGELSSALLDHRVMRILRIPRFLMGESSQQVGCLDHVLRSDKNLLPDQPIWVWGEGVDALTSLLTDPFRAHHHAKRCNPPAVPTRLSDFLLWSFQEVLKLYGTQLSQLEEDVPFDAKPFELPPQSRQEAKLYRRERQNFQDLRKMRAAIQDAYKSLEFLLYSMRSSETWMRSVDAAPSPYWSEALAMPTPGRCGNGLGGAPPPSRPPCPPPPTSGPHPSTQFTAHERALRLAPLAARGDGWATSGLMDLLGFKAEADRAERIDAAAEEIPPRTDEELRRAYRRLWRLVHPDKAPSELKAVAMEASKYVEDAWSAVLRGLSSSPTNHANDGAGVDPRREANDATFSAQSFELSRVLVNAFETGEELHTQLLNLHCSLASLRDKCLFARTMEPGILRSTLLRRCAIVFCTITVAGRSMVSSQRFPTVLIDEACQSCEAESLIAVRTDVQRLFLVGDPQQLRATIPSRTSKRLKCDRSMFERLEEIGTSPLLLCEQYRMDPPVLAWSNSFLYKDRVQTAVDVFRRPCTWVDRRQRSQLEMKLQHDFGNFRLFDILGAEERVRESWRNRDEAQVLLDTLGRFYRLCRPDAGITIAIITPYRAQVDLFETLLPQRLGGADWLREQITVATVDAFQGSERDIVLFSAVRADTKSAGFTSDSRRINVAVTRARHGAWMFGDFSSLERCSGAWASLVPFARNRGWLRSTRPQTKPATPAPRHQIPKSCDFLNLQEQEWLSALLKDGPWIECLDHEGDPENLLNPRHLAWNPWCHLCKKWIQWLDGGLHVASPHHQERRKHGFGNIGHAYTVALERTAEDPDFGFDIEEVTTAAEGCHVLVKHIDAGMVLDRWNEAAFSDFEVKVGTRILEVHGFTDFDRISRALLTEHVMSVDMTVALPPDAGGN